MKKRTIKAVICATAASLVFGAFGMVSFAASAGFNTYLDPFGGHSDLARMTRDTYSDTGSVRLESTSTSKDNRLTFWVDNNSGRCVEARTIYVSSSYDTFNYHPTPAAGTTVIARGSRLGWGDGYTVTGTVRFD